MKTMIGGFWMGVAAFGLSGALPTAVVGQLMGVIRDPDGYVNVRAGQDAKSAVVGKVNAGEVFEFDHAEGSPWWLVSLPGGKSGWMYYDRIVLHVAPEDLSEGEAGSEIDVYGKGKGINYSQLARDAAGGDVAKMKQYFSLDDADGAAGDIHAYMVNSVAHLAGDEKMAAFLAKQPLELQLNVRNEWLNEMALYPFEPFSYVKRHFPKTAKFLLRKELVAWPSPDGKYAIRKVFSDEGAQENVTVDTAQIVDKTTGGVVADFSEEEIGAGQSREGRALWAPDSQTVALFMYDGMQRGELVLYQHAQGVVFQPLALALENELPGREMDEELKGADLIFTRVEPLRWQDDVLVLQRHDYFEKANADGGSTGIGRTYEIQAKVSKGSAKVVGAKVVE